MSEYYGAGDSSDSCTVRLPRWGLFAPTVGYVHGASWRWKDDAVRQLADRKANGEAFKGERVRQLQVTLRIAPGGAVTGYLSPVG